MKAIKIVFLVAVLILVTLVFVVLLKRGSDTGPDSGTGTTVTLVRTLQGIVRIPGLAYVLDSEQMHNPETLETVRELGKEFGFNLYEVEVFDKPIRPEFKGGGSESRVVCFLQHGTQVFVLEQVYLESENQHYFKIETSDCTGWVPGECVSPDLHPTTGNGM